MLPCAVTGYGDPLLASVFPWFECFLGQHALLFCLLLRVIEGGGILLTQFILSLLQNHPSRDHPFKDDVRLWPQVEFSLSSSGYGPVMGMRPPRRLRYRRPRTVIRHYLTMKRLRFRPVQRHRHCSSHLCHPSQQGDTTTPEGLATPLSCDQQKHAGIRDEPTDSPLDAVDYLLCQIDPLTWYHRMKLCAGPLLQGRQDATQALVARADMIKEKLERPRDWSPSTPQVYLTEGVAEMDVPIVLDTGASFSLSPFLSDFVTGPNTSQVTEMTGIADRVKIEGIGVVEWPIVDVFGRYKCIQTHAYYVPKADIRLFSPQTYFQENGKGKCEVDFTKVTLSLPDGTELQFPFHHCSNLPFMLLGTPKEPGLCKVHYREMTSPDFDLQAALSLLDQSNINLTANQKELMLWHWRLMHAGQDWVQTLMATPKSEVGDKPPAPIIPTKTNKASSCVHPVCPACQLAKQHRRTPGHVQHIQDPDREMAIRRENLRPGECTSLDQYVSAFPGRLPNTFGKESPKEKFNGGTIFVDHATSYIYIRNQQSLRVGETLQAKHSYEKFASGFGIKLQKFRADNAPFRSAEFQADLELKDQHIDYSGVGAHFQNGAAERALQTVTKWARSALLHQLLQWPEQALPDLWPYALEHAVHIWNHLPQHHSRMAPIELFTGIKLPEYKAIENA